MNAFDILLIPVIIIFIIVAGYLFMIAMAPIIGAMTLFLIPLTGILVCWPVCAIAIYYDKEHIGKVNQGTVAKQSEPTKS